MFFNYPKVVVATLLLGVILLVVLTPARNGTPQLVSDQYNEQLELLIGALQGDDQLGNHETVTVRETHSMEDNTRYIAEDTVRSAKRLRKDKKKETKWKRRKNKQRYADESVSNNARNGNNLNLAERSGEDTGVVDYDDHERLRRLRVSPLVKLPQDDFWPVLLKPSYGKVFEDFDLSNYTSEDAEYLKQRLPEYIGRAKRVSQVCSSLPQLMTKKSSMETLVWDRTHSPNLVWCQLPKIASSSWNANFFMIGHSADDQAVEHLPDNSDAEETNFNLHHEVFRLFPAPNTTRERAEVFRNAIRFMIVRHPFVRLVSAYRDKITQDRPRPVWFHYEKLQRLIINTYRPSNSTVTDSHPTFQEFVRYVIDQTEGMMTNHDWHSVHCWKPYYVSCGVCANDMQLIMRLESLEDDTRFLATLAGLTQLKEKSTWRHQINGTSSGELSLQLFQQLTKTEVRDLHLRYKIDFDMFGYSPEEYISRATEDKE